MKLATLAVLAAFAPACTDALANVDEAESQTAQNVGSPLVPLPPPPAPVGCDTGMTPVPWTGQTIWPTSGVDSVHLILKRGNNTNFGSTVMQTDFIAIVVGEGTSVVNMFQVPIGQKGTFLETFEREAVVRETPGSGRFHGSEGSVYGGKIPPVPPWPGGTQFTAADVHAFVSLGATARTLHLASVAQEYGQ